MDEPNKEEDLFAWYDWKIEQLDQRLQELSRGSVQRPLLYLLPRLPARIIDELTTGYGLLVTIASIAFVLAASYLQPPRRYSIAVGAEGAFTWRIDSATGKVAVCSPLGCANLGELYYETQSKSGATQAP